MKLLRHILIVCLLATFGANAGEQLTANTKCAVNQPTDAALQLLQGKWEGFSLERGNPDGPSVKGTNTITVTVTGNSLHFQRDTNFWYDTTITLLAGTEPQQLHATIKRGASSIGQVVVVIFKIEDGTLTLATDNGAGEALKGFKDAPNRYELRKVQPQMKMSGSGLGRLVLEGHELHASLKTRQIDDSDQHMPRALIPRNPHVSTNAAFVAAVVRNASRSSLGTEGIRSALYALYREKTISVSADWKLCLWQTLIGGRRRCATFGHITCAWASRKFTAKAWSLSSYGLMAYHPSAGRQ